MSPELSCFVLQEHACLQDPGTVAHFNGSPASLTFAAAPSTATAHAAAAHDRAAEISDTRCFFFAATTTADSGNKQSIVYAADTSGSCNTVVQLAQSTTVIALLYYAAASQLVCVTSDYAMSTHALQHGAWAQVSRMRFSAPSASLANSTLLCAWSGEPSTSVGRPPPLHGNV